MDSICTSIQYSRASGGGDIKTLCKLNAKSSKVPPSLPYFTLYPPPGEKAALPNGTKGSTRNPFLGTKLFPG